MDNFKKTVLDVLWSVLSVYYHEYIYTKIVDKTYDARHEYVSIEQTRNGEHKKKGRY